MVHDQDYILCVVTLVLSLLVLFPSGLTGVKHFGALTKVSGNSKKFKHLFMMLLFFAIFGMSVYVAIENAKKLKDHNE